MVNTASLKQLTNDQLSQVYQRVIDKLVEKGAVSTNDHLYAVLAEIKVRNTGYDTFLKLLYTLAGNFNIDFPTPEQLLQNPDFKFSCDQEELVAFFKSVSRFLDHFMKKEKELKGDGLYVPQHSEPSIFGGKHVGEPSRPWVEWRIKTAGGGVIAAHQIGREIIDQMLREPARQLMAFNPGDLDFDKDGYPSLRSVVDMRYSGLGIYTYDEAHEACLKIYKEGV
jgi:hypothetical protein